jgi:nucleoside-diphosphate-sugar epimerase
MTKKIFLTGATGFLGSHLLDLLIEKEYKITCLVRSPDKLNHINAPNVTLIQGDVTDREVIKKTIPGHTIVFHLAVHYSIGAKCSEKDYIKRTNVEGTRHVLEEAHSAGVEKIIYCSSAGALGPSGQVGTLIDESKKIDLNDGKFYSYYEITKREALFLSRGLVKKGIPIINILPGIIYGPGDPHICGQQVFSIINRTLIGVPVSRCVLTYVHVMDVVAGLMLAAEKGEIGEDYILGGEIMSTYDFLCAVAREAKVAMPKLRLPFFVVRFLTWIYENIPGGKIISKDIPLSKELNNYIKENWAYSSEKSKKELGWHYRPVSEGIVDTVRWFKESTGTM